MFLVCLSHHVQSREQITIEQLAYEFGMTEGANVLLVLCTLRWLGNMGRMTDDCLPKQTLLGGLLSARQFHRPTLMV